MKQKKDTILDPDAIAAIQRNITTIRKKKGFTQIELAKKMGVTQRVISYYENEAQNFGLDAITTLAKALDVSVKKILDSDNTTDFPDLPRTVQKRVDKLKNLSAKGQRTITDMIDMIAKAEGVD